MSSKELQCAETLALVVAKQAVGNRVLVSEAEDGAVRSFFKGQELRAAPLPRDVGYLRTLPSCRTSYWITSGGTRGNITERCVR